MGNKIALLVFDYRDTPCNLYADSRLRKEINEWSASGVIYTNQLVVDLEIIIVATSAHIKLQPTCSVC
jgi:hypothetical protein